MATPNQPHYSQAMLIRLIRQTKDIQDLCDLGLLYKDLAAQEDITITFRLKMEIRIQQELLILRNEEKENDNN